MARVDLALDGVLLRSIFTPPFATAHDTSTAPDGLHTYSAIAVDGKGNASNAAQHTGLVDNTRPDVSFVEPLDSSIVTRSFGVEVCVAGAGARVVALDVDSSGATLTTNASREYVPPVKARVEGLDEGLITPIVAHSFSLLISGATAVQATDVSSSGSHGTTLEFPRTEVENAVAPCRKLGRRAAGGVARARGRPVAPALRDGRSLFDPTGRARVSEGYETAASRPLLHR